MATLDYMTGDGTAFDDQEIVNDMKANGYPVVGSTADGLNAVVSKPDAKKGEETTFNIPLETYLKQRGEQVTGITPQPGKSGNDNISDWLSVGAQKFDDPDMKKFYVKNALHKRHGLQDAQVIGTGNDLHVWDPEAGQWEQITHEPKWNNLAGLGAAGLALPHMFGMAAGGAAGTPTGAALGSVAGPAGTIAGGLGGAAVGAGLGSAGAEYGTRALMGEFDPSFAETREKYPMEDLKEVGTTAGEDALAETGAKGLSLGWRALGPTGRKTIMKLAEEGENPFAQLPSTFAKAGQAVGESLEGVGGAGFGGLGKLADSPNAREFAAQALPVVGPMVQAGETASLPAAGIRGIAKLAQKVPEWSITKNLFKDSADKIGAWGRAISEEAGVPRNLAQKGDALVENAAQTAGKPARDAGPTARDIMHNIVNRASNKPLAEEAYANSPDLAAGFNQDKNLIREFAQQEGFDLSPEQIDAIHGETQAPLREQYIEDYLKQSGENPNWGTAAGSVADKVGAIGDATRAAVRGPIGIAARAGQAGFGGLAGAGYVLKNASKLAEPLELPASLRYGIPSLRDWWKEHNR